MARKPEPLSPAQGRVIQLAAGSKGKGITRGDVHVYDRAAFDALIRKGLIALRAKSQDRYLTTPAGKAELKVLNQLAR